MLCSCPGASPARTWQQRRSAAMRRSWIGTRTLNPRSRGVRIVHIAWPGDCRGALHLRITWGASWPTDRHWDRGTVLNRRADDRLKTAGRPRCQPTPHRRWSAGPARRPGSRRPDRGPCRRRLRVRGRKSGRRPAKRRMLRKIFSQPSAAAESRAGTTPLKQYWVSVSVARNGRPGFHILAAAMSCGVWVGAGTLAATSATKSSTASHHVVVVGSNQVMSAGGIAERAVR